MHVLGDTPHDTSTRTGMRDEHMAIATRGHHPHMHAARAPPHVAIRDVHRMPVSICNACCMTVCKAVPVYVASLIRMRCLQCLRAVAPMCVLLRCVPVFQVCFTSMPACSNA